MFLTEGLREHFKDTNNLAGRKLFAEIDCLEEHANREDISIPERLATIYKIYDLRVAAAALEGTAVITGPIV